MDPFHLSLALGPISVYLLVIGRINLGRRAFVTTGARDAFVMSIATLGCFVAGPMDLFMPEGAVSNFGLWVWPLLLGLYFFCALLIVLLMRPRLIVYNISTEKLYSVLERVAAELDPECRRSGACFLLPNLEVQLMVESTPAMRNVQLIAGGDPHQNLNSWRQIRHTLTQALDGVEVLPNRRGVSFVVFGLAIASVVLVELFLKPQQVAQAMDFFLRR